MQENNVLLFTPNICLLYNTGIKNICLLNVLEKEDKVMKRYFFIDKENTGKRFLKGLKELSKNDTIIIFHCEQQGEIKNDILLALATTKAAIEIRKMQIHTKNAMDFQICTYMGYLYKTYGNKAEYYIVSNDHGYDASIEFIKMQLDPKAKIERINCEMNISEEENTLENVLSGKYKKKIINKIKAGMKETADKAQFHNFLQQNFHEDFMSIYALIKPVYEEAKAYYA